MDAGIPEDRPLLALCFQIEPLLGHTLPHRQPLFMQEEHMTARWTE